MFSSEISIEKSHQTIFFGFVPKVSKTGVPGVPGVL